MKIRVNDSYLDLFPNARDQFFISKQIYDLSNLQSRNSDYSRVFEIPKSPHNQSVLQAFENSVRGNNFDCLLEIDGITLLKGTISVLEIGGQSITITIYSGNFDLFTAIPDESIKSLDLYDYNIAWTVANMAAYDDTTDGLIITQINYLDQESIDDGTGIPSSMVSSQDIKNFGFCFYVKTLIEKIVTNAGFTYDDSNLTSYDDYNNLVLICPVLIKGRDENIVFAKVSFSSDYTYDSSVEGGAPVTLPFDTTISDGAGIWDNVNYEFTLNSTDQWRFIFDYSINYTRSQVGNVCQIDVLQNGTSIIEKTYAESVNQDDFIDISFPGTSGDVIKVQITCDNPSDVAIISSGSSFKLQEDKPDPNELIVTDHLPDINQRTLFLEFCKQFNVLVQSDPISKTTTFKLWNDMITETPQDLTANIDTSREITETLSFQTYYRKSLLKYDNEAERDDTDYEVIFDRLPNLQKQGTILQSVFSGSDGAIMNVPYCVASYRSAQNFTINSGSNLFTFGNSEDFKPGDYIYYNNQIDRIQLVSSKTTGQLYNTSPANYSNIDVQIIKFNPADLRPRIGIIEKASTFSPFLSINGYRNGVTTANLYRVYFYNTWKYLHDNYYKNMFDALKDMKIITAYFNLPTVDLYGLDLTKPVQIDGLQGTYYINRIEQWKPGQPCRMELVRINKLM